MDKKIVTFTMSERQSQFEVNRLETEATKMGIEVNKALYRELSFDLETRGFARVFVRGEELTAENTLGLWFRVAGTKSGKYTEARNLAIRILEKKGVKCVNSSSYLGWTRMGKIAQHGVFLKGEILTVPTKIFYTKEQVLSSGDNAFFDWEYPVIVKHERGSQGKSVRKIESRQELIKYLKKINEKNVGMMLWQKYLPTRWDLRVIVIDYKAIGGMKRSAEGEEFRSNFSLGGSVDVWQLSDEERSLAEKVARLCNLDYCGVDIMKDEEGNNFILEVNRQCQFKGFEQATGINVAKEVVDMLRKNN